MASDTWIKRSGFNVAESVSRDNGYQYYLCCHVLTDGLNLRLDIVDQQVQLVFDKLQSVPLVLPVLQRRHSESPRQQRSESELSNKLARRCSGWQSANAAADSLRLPPEDQHSLKMTTSSFNCNGRKRAGCSPLLRRLDVYGVHDVLDFFCDLLGPDRVLLKLCFHC